MSSNRHKQAQSLKQLVTEERRTINPKYGRQHVEWNSCRWLVFSNSITALPLEDGDRRWYVVANKEKPKPSEYYARLYGLIKDLSFIASVAHALAVRDISAFRAGERPPLNAAKQAVLDRSKSEFELDLQDIREHWPSDLIASHELQEVIGEDDWPTRGVVRYRLDDASIIKLHGYQDYNAWKKREKRMIYCLRNLDHWQSAGRTKCDAEIRSRPLSEKTADYDANRRKH